MAIAETPEPTGEFEFFLDLGILEVPEEYISETWLDSFRRAHRKSFADYSVHITDKNFPYPSRILRPGDRLWVRAVRQIPAISDTERHLAFLDTQGAVYPGPHALPLLWQQKYDLLPRDVFLYSLDQTDRLWKDHHDFHNVPFLRIFTRSGQVLSHFLTTKFEGERYQFCCASLCFCEVPVR